MKQQMAALFDLQETDVKISQAEAQLSALDGAKQFRKRYALAKAGFEAADKEYRIKEAETKDCELALKSIDEKRIREENRMYSGAITNPKELSAVEKEIVTLKVQQSDLDSRVLELYEAVEKLKSAADAGKVALEEAEKRARMAIKKEAVEKERLETELAQLTKERTEKVSRIEDSMLLSRYEQAKKRTCTTGAALVDDGKCGACHMSITSFMMRDLYTKDEIQRCENCGRILILDI